MAFSLGRELGNFADAMKGGGLIPHGGQKKADDATKKAAALQDDATQQSIGLVRESRDLMREDLSPYKDLGGRNIDAYQNLLNPQGQSEYIQGNPLYKALADDAQKRLFSNQAARGKLGSGETAEGLQDALLRTGAGLMQNDRNALLQTINMGQNSAAMSGNASQGAASNMSNLLTSNANAQGAAGIASANVGMQNMTNMAGMGLSAMALMSDVRLKENIQYVGEANGFGWYTWDWTEEGAALVNGQPTEGHLAQEIQAERPDAIIEREDGYLMINMGALN